MSNPKITITNLRCEYLKDPIGIESANPRLSWEIVADSRGTVQTHYQIIVASSSDEIERGICDIWDSGKVESSSTAQIEYKGKELASSQKVFWKVLCWTNGAEEASSSEPALWEMGILQKDGWQGEWICYPVSSISNSPYFRKSFALKSQPRKAVIYYTAKGIGNAYINGKPVGDELFTPGWTDYEKRIYYSASDVTDLLHQGENAIGSVIGEGWYKGPMGFQGSTNVYGQVIQFLANLRVEYEDGSIEIIATDDSWKTTTGPIHKSGFLYGEEYDARFELGDWASPSYDDSSWQKVNTIGFKRKYWDNAKMAEVTAEELLQSYPCEPVRVTQEFKPTDMWESIPGSFVFDLGQNFAGRIRMKVKGKSGQVIRIRHGEMVNSDRTLYVENLRSAVSVDTYVIGSNEEVEWEPQFTFHGFRYVELSGIDNPSKDMLVGRVIGSDTTPVGKFECSNKLVNQLYSNIVWTQRANFLEIPTDCPQRDERLGWTGDAQAYIRTAVCNMDVAAFFKKWMVDVVDTQDEKGGITNVAPGGFIKDTNADAAWGDAITICPWTIYKCYGDKRILADNYEAMKKFVDHYYATSKGYLREEGHCFGDWLSIGADTPREVIKTAYFAYSARIIADSAGVLGKKDDAKKYGELLKNIKDAFCKAYVFEDGTVKGDTQTCYLLAIWFDLVPEGMVEKCAQKLEDRIHDKQDHLSTGFVGCPYLMPTLTKIGRHELACKLLENKTYPSWLYSVVNGATTIWERWNGWKDGEGCGDANMNSFSHYAYGSVGEWLFSSLAGIDLAEIGFDKILIQPRPGGDLTYANAEHTCIHGKIVSSWKINADKFSLEVEIPANTTATVKIPTSSADTVKESGRNAGEAEGVTASGSEPGFAVFEVGSGKYSFEATR